MIGLAPFTGDHGVDKYIEAEPNSGCWLWIGFRKARDYGGVQRGGRCQIAHRYIYTRLVGPIPEGLTLDHLCRTHSCVNPAHLEPVTQRENVLRGAWGGAINARKTHCSYGHEFNETNTIYWRTQRICRLCQRRKHMNRVPALIRGRYRTRLSVLPQ